MYPLRLAFGRANTGNPCPAGAAFYSRGTAKGCAVKKTTGTTAARNAAPPLNWWELFDDWQAKRVCEAVRIAISNRLLDHSPVAWFAEIIRKELLNPLDAYMVEHLDPDMKGTVTEIEKATELFNKGKRLAELCEDEWPFSEGDEKHYSSDIYQCWIEFIAIGAGPYVSFGIPQNKKTKSTSARLPRGNATELTPQRVADYMREHGLTELSDEEAEKLASQFPARFNGPPPSVRTVRRRLKEAREKRIPPFNSPDPLP